MVRAYTKTTNWTNQCIQCYKPQQCNIFDSAKKRSTVVMFAKQQMNSFLLFVDVVHLHNR